MSAESRWAELLEAHEVVYQSDGDYGEINWIECSCGDDYFVETDADELTHRVHVAAIIAAAVAEEQAKAWDEGYDWGYSEAVSAHTRVPMRPNPYRTSGGAS